MSKSRKKIAICGICCCKSEKNSKKIWHSRFRAMQRASLQSRCIDDDDYIPISVRNASNPWLMQKDGKQYLSIKRLVQCFID